MNFTELVDAVYTETGRPDLVAQTQQQVVGSTRKMHGLDFFFKDIATVQALFDITGYVQTLDTSVLPLYRSMMYVRKWDPTFQSSQLNPTILPPLTNSVNGVISPNIALAFLDPLAPDDIFSTYGQEKTDVYYQVGSTLMMKSSTSFIQALIGYYKHPDTRAVTFTSWIAEEFPFAIIYDAASAILQKTGKQDVARKYDAGDLQHPIGLVWSHVFNIINSNIQVQGR